MPRRRRRDVIREDVVGVYHAWIRCVRRARLCGIDAVTGGNYEHRKAWIEQRLAQLARIFAIDACVFAVLSNHYHLLLRNRPDLVAQWSDEEVGRRWWQLYPERRDEYGEPAEPTPIELQSLLANTDRVAELRKRLSSISWLMKSLNEWIAKRANGEDNTSGHFFEARFKCRSLLDEGAILAAAIYVDLNEIRARLAETPEESRHTSAYYRLLARTTRERRTLEESAAASSPSATDAPASPGDWLCPIDEQACEPLLGPADVESVVRSRTLCGESASQAPADASATIQRGAASKSWRHGFLPMTEDEYLSFLDWNARQVIPGKSGATDPTLPPILERLKMAPAAWITMIENLEGWFHTAVGTSEHLMAEAARLGLQWLQGVGRMRAVEGQLTAPATP